MTTQVSIILDSAENVLSIPASALQSDPQGRYQVQIYNPATDERIVKSVEVGLNNDANAAILSGLSEGEQVVISAARTEPAADEPRVRMPPIGL